MSEKVFKQLKTAGTGSEATPDLYALIGKNFAYYTECTDEAINESMVKMISGEDNISIRGLYKDFQTVKLTCKLCLCGNEKMGWRYTKSMLRRLELMVFLCSLVDHPKKPNERKKEHNLVLDLNQIFSFIVQGSKRIYENKKFTKSKICDLEMKKYINEMNSTTEFINNMIIEVPEDKNNTIKKSEIYSAYVKWCENNNIRCEKKGDFHNQLLKKYNTRKTGGNYVYDLIVRNYNIKYNTYEDGEEENEEDESSGNLFIEDSVYNQLKHSKDLNEQFKTTLFKLEKEAEENKNKYDELNKQLEELKKQKTIYPDLSYYEDKNKNLKDKTTAELLEYVYNLQYLLVKEKQNKNITIHKHEKKSESEQGQKNHYKI
jgi:hypothetical protein